MPIIDLMNELPYAAALSADFIPHRCLFCFLPIDIDKIKNSRCPKCQVVLYCNVHCQEKDSFEHEPECRAYRNFKVAQRPVIDDANAAYGDEKLRLLARLVRRQRRDHGNVDLTTNRPDTVKVRKLSDLMSHKENLLHDAVRSMHLQDYASDLYGFFDRTTEEFSPFYTTVDEVEELVGKMCINCFGIPVTTADDETHIGVAVYLTSSRFDHTCKPNLFMDFEGNKLVCRYVYDKEEDKEPDYDKLTVSYGCTPMYAGFTAVPTRQQRQLSLSTRYYFICKCEWCSSERDSDLSESATTRKCKACGMPFVFEPTDKANGFTLRQICDCTGQDGKFNDCFDKDGARLDLDKLIKGWSTTIHPTENIQSASEAITKLEPLKRLAQRYWHPVLNLRYVQLNETLFHAYRSFALAGCKDPEFVSSPTIYPIPQTSAMTGDARAKLLTLGCLAGEMTVAAYQKRLEPYETVVARFCYQLAQLYELAQNFSGAVKNYTRARDIWKYHGERGDSQCKTVEQRLEKAMKAEASKNLLANEVKHVQLDQKEANEEKLGQANGENSNEKEKTEKKKKNKKKKK